LGSRQFFLKNLDGYEWHDSLLLNSVLDLSDSCADFDFRAGKR
jgi:hypothetical protein